MSSYIKNTDNILSKKQCGWLKYYFLWYFSNSGLNTNFLGHSSKSINRGGLQCELGTDNFPINASRPDLTEDQGRQQQQEQHFNFEESL